MLDKIMHRLLCEARITVNPEDKAQARRIQILWRALRAGYQSGNESAVLKDILPGLKQILKALDQGSDVWGALFVAQNDAEKGLRSPQDAARYLEHAAGALESALDYLDIDVGKGRIGDSRANKMNRISATIMPGMSLQSNR